MQQTQAAGSPWRRPVQRWDTSSSDTCSMSQDTPGHNVKHSLSRAWSQESERICSSLSLCPFSSQLMFECSHLFPQLCWTLWSCHGCRHQGWTGEGVGIFSRMTVISGVEPTEYPRRNRTSNGALGAGSPRPSHGRGSARGAPQDCCPGCRSGTSCCPALRQEAVRSCCDSRHMCDCKAPVSLPGLQSK